jgi:hypothetical protein
MLKDKVKKSLEVIEEQLSYHNRPVIWSSFGKDSLVLMDLIYRIDKNIPILFCKEYFCFEKYEHAERIIKRNNLTVYSYPPIITALQCCEYEGQTEWEIQNYYSLPNGKNFTCPTGIVDNPKSKHCALRNIYSKPFANVNYIWDCQFIGHKSTDTDAFYNSLELNDYVYKQEGVPTFIFPLKDWTDADIWEFIHSRGINYNSKRYVRGIKKLFVNGWRGQNPDVTYNPDYFECCLECMKKENTGKKVFCPYYNDEIDCIAEKIRYTIPPDVAYMKGNKDNEF